MIDITDLQNLTREDKLVLQQLLSRELGNPSDAMNPVLRLNRDIRAGAANLGDDEARFLVDSYYVMQEDRKRSFAQARTLEENKEPNEVIKFFAEQSKTLEKQIAVTLDVYTQNHMMGEWMRSVYGIGPVLSAGLLAHIDISKCPTAGHIWSFAGLVEKTAWLGGKKATEIVSALVDGTRSIRGAEELIAIANKMECSPKWLARRIFKIKNGIDAPYQGHNRETPDAEYIDAILKGVFYTRKEIVEAVSKRPHNSDLKVICWKIGQSFMKFSNNEQCYYGQIYRQRKAYEQANTNLGKHADAAAKGAAKVGKDTEAYKHYSAGHLPPAQIDGRARRYAVKLFLSHLHDEWYRRYFKAEPPKPYPIAILGHAHYIAPPQTTQPAA